MTTPRRSTGATIGGCVVLVAIFVMGFLCGAGVMLVGLGA